jgi:hypothetical protein
MMLKLVQVTKNYKEFEALDWSISGKNSSYVCAEYVTILSWCFYGTEKRN